MNIDSVFLSKLDKIQDKLASCGIYDTVVSGGAIRDMLFDKPIKDIDIFYTAHSSWSTPLSKYFNVIPQNTKYEGTSYQVTHTLVGQDIPLPIQLIKVKGNIEDHIKEFPINICMSYYKNSELTIPVHVLFADDTKVMEIYSNCSKEYKERILSKYYDWFADEGLNF